MRDYPQHTITNKEKTSSEIIEDIATRCCNNTGLLRINLRMLVLVAQKEQMIEDHNLYMSKE